MQLSCWFNQGCVSAPIRSDLTVIENRGMSSLRYKKIATDFGIAVVVVLFFVAGVFFESRRSDNRLPSVTRDVGAESVSTASATQQASSAAATATPSASVQPTATITAQATAVPVLPGTPNPEAVGQAVFLDVQGIENESVVLTSTITVTGFTTPDALLSVDGQAVPVQLDGSFSVDVNLEPGPNFVGFVSSNLRGQESSRVISVVSIQ